MYVGSHSRNGSITRIGSVSGLLLPYVPCEPTHPSWHSAAYTGCKLDERHWGDTRVILTEVYFRPHCFLLLPPFLVWSTKNGLLKKINIPQQGRIWIWEDTGASRLCT